MKLLLSFLLIGFVVTAVAQEENKCERPVASISYKRMILLLDDKTALVEQPRLKLSENEDIPFLFLPISPFSGAVSGICKRLGFTHGRFNGHAGTGPRVQFTSVPKVAYIESSGTVLGIDSPGGMMRGEGIVESIICSRKD